MEYKQVIAVRSDLKMGKGKTAVQVAHAAVLGAEESRLSHAIWYSAWRDSGMAKIAVRVPALDELRRIEITARRMGITVVEVEDRGLTQLEPGTVTCAAFGPAPSSKLDPMTGSLRLL